jgi:ParB/RepB/Spo0J family partition protein
MDDFQMVPVSSVRPSGQNPRLFRRNARFQELRDNVARHGVLQPLLVRPVAPEAYEIVFGERRWRAASEVGLESIPVQVRELSDDEALRLTIAENAHREDLSPLEEMRSVDMLFRVPGMTLALAAAELGRSVRWVAERRVLKNLSEGWIAAIAPGQRHEDRRLGELSLVARFDPMMQDELLRQLEKSDEPFVIEHVRQWFAARMMDLSRVPWDVSREMAGRPGGGTLPSCEQCLQRSSVQSELFTPEEFGERAEGDRCLNAACFGWKTAQVTRERVARLREANPRAPVVVARDASWAEGQSLKREFSAQELGNTMQRVKAGTPGAKPFIVVGGAESGRVAYYVSEKTAAKKTSNGESDETVEETLEVRLARAEEAHQGKTNRAYIGAVAHRLEQFVDGTPLEVADKYWGERRENLVHVLAALAAVYGTVQQCGWWDAADQERAEELLGDPPGTRPDRTARLLATQVLMVIVRRLERKVKEANLAELARPDGVIREARWLSELLLRITDHPEAAVDPPPALLALRAESQRAAAAAKSRGRRAKSNG